MINRLFLFVLIGCLLGACNNEVKQAPVTSAAGKAPALMPPFRFHKLIEVSPGEDFDIYSWGRGAKDVGSFLILHSDSAGMKYTTTTGDLDGAIVDVYNSDMDMDGNPEILMQAKATDTANYAVIYAFEFNDNKAQKLDFPKLTISQRQGYRGGDNFYIQDGAFMRQFPIYDGNGKGAKPTGQKRLLQYGLRNNEFTVKQLSKDSTKVTNNPSIRETPFVPKEKHSSKKEKHSSNSHKNKKHKTEEHKTTSHKKKKHRRND
jgi:hypothetical protein